MKNLRRIVTGHNEAGKSIIMIDAVPMSQKLVPLLQPKYVPSAAVPVASNHNMDPVSVIDAP